MTKNCPTCGTANPDEAAFCDNCGAKLPDAAAVAPPQPQPPAWQQQPPAPSPQPSPSAGGVTCPACGKAAMPGEAFCDNCGASLTNVAAGVQPVQPPPQQQWPVQPPPQAMQPSARFIMSSGAQLTIPTKPEVLIGREDSASSHFPDVDLGPYDGFNGGVSRKHAKLTWNGANYALEDMDTVNKTFVNDQQLRPNVPQPLPNGARVRMGKVMMTFQSP